MRLTWMLWGRRAVDTSTSARPVQVAWICGAWRWAPMVAPAERLTTRAGDEMNPAVAPDGHRLVFAARDPAPDPDNSPQSDRFASFRSTRDGGDIWVLDGI